MKKRSKRRASSRPTKALYDNTLRMLHNAHERLNVAEPKAELWDKIVEAVRDSVMPDIEEKVSDAVEEAVSGLSIS
jgi:hypothetical protein